MSDFMLELTKEMPMKQIDVGGQPYLQRYYAGTFELEDCDLWFHRFLSADGDRHLHNHPFDATSIILTGGYREERPGGIASLRMCSGRSEESVASFLTQCVRTDFVPSVVAACHRISAYYWHRIAWIYENTWTAMIVRKDRLPFWYFRDDQDNLISVPSSPREWWKECGPRNDQKENLK